MAQEQNTGTRKNVHQKVFERERDVLRSARAMADSSGATPEDYAKLVEEYERLLKQEEKIVVIGDLTQNKLLRAQKMLHRAMQRYKAMADQKSELLSIVSHDIKNKIGPIRELASWVVEDLEKGEDKSHAIELMKHIGDASEQLAKSVNDTLHRESSRSTTIIPVFEWADVSKLVLSIVETQRASATKKNIAIESAFVPGCEAYVDEFLIGEVMENLVSNAIKFSPCGTSVKTVLEATDRMVTFSVVDHGPGLSEEDKLKLFGKYQTLSAKPTGGEVSTGIGLYIASKLASMHNGRLEASSDGPGTGSTFRLFFPIPDDGQEAAFAKTGKAVK
jgi:signal transduction histidine kinase